MFYSNVVAQFAESDMLARNYKMFVDGWNLPTTNQTCLTASVWKYMLTPQAGLNHVSTLAPVEGGRYNINTALSVCHTLLCLLC